MIDEPRDVDCHTVIERLYEFLDGELDDDRAAQVRHHLERCAKCLGLSNFEASYIAFLEARARGQGAPPDLKRRILNQLLLGDDSANE